MPPGPDSSLYDTMNSVRPVLRLAYVLAFSTPAWFAFGQEKDKDASAPARPAAGSGASAATPAAPSPKPKLTQAELEANFKETLTKATLAGRWCGLQNGKLTPEREDKYTIVSVAKLGGEAWIVN